MHFVDQGAQLKACWRPFEGELSQGQNQRRKLLEVTGTFWESLMVFITPSNTFLYQARYPLPPGTYRMPHRQPKLSLSPRLSVTWLQKFDCWLLQTPHKMCQNVVWTRWVFSWGMCVVLRQNYASLSATLLCLCWVSSNSNLATTWRRIEAHTCTDLYIGTDVTELIR